MTDTQTVSLFDVIAWVESKNCPHATRFEPKLFDHVCNGGAVSGDVLTTIKSIHNCSDMTARTIYCTSYGAVQIMGFNLYDGHFAGDFVSFLCDPVAQFAAFDAFVDARKINYSVDDLCKSVDFRMDFAKKYNGDAVAYSAQIVLALVRFGLQVTQ